MPPPEEIPEPTEAELAQPEVDPAQALGASSRGNAPIPGSDLPEPKDPTTLEVPSNIPVQEGLSPTEPKSQFDRVAAAQQAVSARRQMLKDRWDADYSASKNVPANGYDLLPEEKDDMVAQGIKLTPRNIAAHAARLEAQAQRDAILSGESQHREALAAATNERNQQLAEQERQMIDSGQVYHRLPDGSLYTPKDPSTGKPLYHATGWESAINPQTGLPALKKRDAQGNTDYRGPRLTLNPTDMNDTRAYAVMPDGSTKAYGDIDSLTKDPDFSTASQAQKLQAVMMARAAAAAEKPLLQRKNEASAQKDYAMAQRDKLKTDQDQTQAMITTLSASPQLDDPVVGPQKRKELEDLQNKQLQNSLQIGKLDESLDPASGPIARAAQQTSLEHAAFKATVGAKNFSNLEDQRMAILKNQGATDAQIAADPTLQSIRTGRANHEALLQQANAKIQKLNPQPLTDEQRIASAGERLPLGAPVPGKPGLFESVHDEPPAPGVTPSKYTMTDPAMTKRIKDLDTLKTFNDFADKMSPYINTGLLIKRGLDSLQKVSQAVGSMEPSALAKAGVQYVGAKSTEYLARQYGVGDGPVNPLSLVKIQARNMDIQSMLTENRKNLSPAIVHSLEMELEGNKELYSERLNKLSPESQTRVAAQINDLKTSKPGAFGRHLGLGILPNASFAVTAGLVTAAATKASPAFAARTFGVGPILAGIGSAMLVSKGVEAAMDKSLKTIDPEMHARLQDLLQKDAEQHPGMSFLGDQAAMATAFKVDPQSSIKNFIDLLKVAKNRGGSVAELEGAKSALVLGGLATAQTFLPSALHKEKLTWQEVVSNYAQMGIYGQDRFGIGHPAAKPEAKAQVEAKPEAKAEAAPKEPFRANGKPDNAAQAAAVFEPDSPEVREANKPAPKETPAEPIKPAKEAAQAILDAEAAAKHEKDYKENPLVVDPERRAKELRDQISQIEAENAKHAAEAEGRIKAREAAPAEEAKARAALGLTGEAPKSDAARQNELDDRKAAIERELEVADRLRKSPQGAEALKQDLADQAAGKKPETTEEKPNAVPEPSAGKVLQRESQPAGEAGGERGRVEPGQQGKGPAAAGKAQEAVQPEVKSQLGDTKVKIKVKNANGTEKVVEWAANKAEDRVNKHLSSLETLKKCLEGTL